jgi:hypothetical protein
MILIRRKKNCEKLVDDHDNSYNNWRRLRLIFESTVKNRSKISLIHIGTQILKSGLAININSFTRLSPTAALNHLN